jgi:hypothetical protein
MAELDTAIQLAKAKCGCEGVGPREYVGHCDSRELVYAIPRQRFIREVVKNNRLVGRERYPNLLLCGTCGREYKLMGYRVVLLPGAELRVIPESGKLGLPVKASAATA